MTAETLIALSSVSVAIAVALITLRQWITARDALKHDLYDRRYAIYERVGEFLAGVLQTGTVHPGEDVKFLRETKQARFVFSGDNTIKALILGIYRDAVHLHALEAALPSLNDKAREENIEAQRKIKEQFSQTLSSLEVRFEKYLRLDH